MKGYAVKDDEGILTDETCNGYRHDHVFVIYKRKKDAQHFVSREREYGTKLKIVPIEIAEREK